MKTQKMEAKMGICERENKSDLRIMVSAVRDLISLIDQIEEGDLPLSEETKIALQSSAKELCKAIYACL